ncbi:hypothetical protein ACVIWU_006697 [Bradyrhizobium sp. USDA 4509]
MPRPLRAGRLAAVDNADVPLHPPKIGTRKLYRLEQVALTVEIA